MKHLLVLIVFLQIGFHGVAQGSVVLNQKPFEANRTMDTAVLGPLTRSPYFSDLPERTRELFYWTSLVRNKPGYFLANYVQPFLQQFPEARSTESRTLTAELSRLQPASAVLPSPRLQVSSGEHAAYLASKGQLSHTGRGGKDFPQRMKELGITECAGENVFDGQDDALLAVILLLIDHGMPGVGHRKAILNPAFTVAGMGIAYMKDGRLVLAQQFSCK